jgi:serine/threonine protein kinase
MEPSAPRASTPSAGSRVGEVLAGKYRLEALLGSGGMGDVYRAVNELVGRAVAIKLLRPEHAENSQVVERFMREARAANLVRHENVVDVIDVGQDDKGSPFIVQELLDGEDLMAFARRMGGKIPLEETIDLLCPVIDAVAEAHAQGVVHRDIKPENVFLVKKGIARVPKLLDFGISKVRSADIRTTEAGVMLGTPAYMAPEQLQGARDADARTDVWAIGVMLFELLAGRLPFDAADAPSLFVKIATTDAPKLIEVMPEIPPTVSRLVDRCLRRKPDDRYPSAAELARDLRHVLEGTEIEPTLRRSIPPSLAALVPDLLLPRAPTAPKMDVEQLKEAGVDSSDARLLGQKVPAQIAEGARAVIHKPTPPEVPSLVPAAPPPKAAAPAKAKAAPAKPGKPAEPPPPANPAARTSEPVLQLAGSIAHDPRAGRVVTDAGMPGMMMGPSSSARTRAAPRRRGEGDGTADDISAWVIGIVIVGFTAIFAFGAIMQLAHRPEGWPLMAFISAPGSGLVTVGQLGLALVMLAVSITNLRRGVKHWRGELAGGLSGAVIGGLIGAIAFFAAVEFATPIW